MSLVDVLNQLNVADEEMNKEAEEMNKMAAEEEAAGRIMARGFLDELNKLAAELESSPVKPPTAKPIPSGPYPTAAAAKQAPARLPYAPKKETTVQPAPKVKTNIQPAK